VFRNELTSIVKSKQSWVNYFKNVIQLQLQITLKPSNLITITITFGAT